jgi:HD-GYP domain-containing protein (c-di-GMP phosphodiesterase class II)
MQLAYRIGPAPSQGLRATIDQRQDRLAGSLRETLQRLALAAELRDPHLAGHAERVGELTGELAERLGYDAGTCAAIQAASRLHDVGKIGVPDSVLQNPGRLNAAERATIGRHTVIGHAMLAETGDPVLELAARIALTHHEHVDGEGYPYGLMGHAIPHEARMVAITDTFDALTSSRVYRPARSVDEAIDILRQGRGSHFDADMLECFLDAVPDVTHIQRGGTS